MMDKYAQLKRFHHDRQLQVYMYAFMYINHQIMPLEDHFIATKTFLMNYKKISTPVTVPKNCIVFSRICS